MKRVLALATLLVAGVVAVLVVACGGGESEADPPTEKALGSGLGSVIAWSPASITDTANPGSRQDIPVTFTASANVPNVTVSVVPALQKFVTASPTSFASLQKGQVATVTLTVAPSAAVTLGTVQGTVQLRAGGSTLASPLTVTLALVAPEIINGITVPPEPPANLNNATLAGFDANGNGVRDDVERMLANDFARQPARYQEVLSFSRAEQSLLVARRSTSSQDSYMNTIACALERGMVTSDDLDKVTYADLNTRERGNTYGHTLAGAIGRACK